MGEVDGNAVRFVGTYTFNDHVYPVVMIDDDPDSGYLVSPFISATSFSDLPTEISSTDKEFTPASDGDIVTCFTQGAEIETPRGPRAVEDLKVGDLVLTVDNGPQPIDLAP